MVPATAFAEPTPQRDESGTIPNVWFAIDENQQLFFFAGIQCRCWTGERKANEDAAEHELFAFLTTEPNAVVASVHKKAMPLILTEPDEIETWLDAPLEKAEVMQRPLAEGRLFVLPSH